MSGRRPLSRVIAPVLVGAAFVPMLLIAGVNYVATAQLDRDQSLGQLGELQQSRAHTIKAGLERQRQTVAVLAADRSVVAALVEFREALDVLDAIDEPLDAGAAAELDRFARGLVADDDLRAVVAATGLEIPTVEQLVPDDPAARYLHYHYVITGSREVRVGVDDPGDGSLYSAAHARHHPALRQLTLNAGFVDLMLVTLDDDRVVYTVGKGPDFGIDAFRSVFGAGRPGSIGLGAVLESELPRAATGEAVLVDVQPYLGAGGRPVMFVAAAVSDGRQVVGALVAQVPIDGLNRLMTADGQWIEAGLGQTGESYVVGRDLLVRSDRRSYLEDPDAHLSDLRDEGLDGIADAVAAAESTVLTQIVDTEPVRTALGGTTFTGRAAGHDGVDTLTVASPLGVPDLDWVVVAQIDRSEATAESSRQRRTLLLLGAILLPAVALAGLVLARRVSRPVGPLVEAAEQVAAGDRYVGPVDPSRDEYGHLSRELHRYAEALATEDAVLHEERQALDELLLAVPPARAIDAVRSGELDLGDLVDTATVIAVTVDGLPEDRDAGWANERTGHLAADLEALATRHGVERVWSSADRHLYVAGLGRDDHGCDDAVRFVDGARAILAAHAEELAVTISAGLAAGTVTTGVVGGDQLSFGMWGEPTRLALALGAVGVAGEVLVHDTVATRLIVAGLLDGRRTRVDLGDGEIEVHLLRTQPSDLALSVT